MEMKLLEKAQQLKSDMVRFNTIEVATGNILCNYECVQMYVGVYICITCV